MELPGYPVGRRSTFGHRINFEVGEANSNFGICNQAYYLPVRRLFQFERFRYPWNVSHPRFLRKTGVIGLPEFRRWTFLDRFFWQHLF